MNKVYTGKTKDVYRLPDGNYLLKFKDDATGENGVFDPGANTVGLSIEGMGMGSLAMTTYFFKKLGERGVDTHWISSDLNDISMTVKAAEIFGRGVEVICRYRAVGSFLRRYGAYVKDGDPLPALVEITLKDDDRGDPLVTADTLEALGIMSPAEYDELKQKTRDICEIIKAELAARGLELFDIKLEFGRVGGRIILIDEIAGGNMRVFKGDRQLQPLELAAMFT